MKLICLYSKKGKMGLLALALLGCVSACQLDDEVVSSNKVQAEEIISDEALADNIFEDVDIVCVAAAAVAENSRLQQDNILGAACVSYVVENTGLRSKKVTLTFEEGCVGPDGKERSGAIMINMDLSSTSYTFTITFQDFYSDGNKIEGNRTSIFTLKDGVATSIFTNLVDGKITLKDGKVITRYEELGKTIDRKAGEIRLNGFAYGHTRGGISYSASIMEPVIYKKSCVAGGVFMPVQGRRSIMRGGNSDFEVDYGTGTCDKEVTIYRAEENYVIEINSNKQ